MDELVEAIQKLTRDLRSASKTMDREEARFLVDQYYSMQHDRIRAKLKSDAMTKSAEPHETLEHFKTQFSILEEQVKKALDWYSSSDPVGEWARSNIGVGPVIAAGLLAHIDITRTPSPSHLWSFAGLNPKAVWEKDKKRPWNAKLKRLCWILGESFTKTSTHPDTYYGKIYSDRKKYEIANNDSGKYSDYANLMLQKKNYSGDTDTKKWLTGCFPAGLASKILDVPAASRPHFLATHQLPPGEGQPMLSPLHIHRRSQRYAVKIFLAHYHWVAHEIEFKTASPSPWIIEFGGHVDLIYPPNYNALPR